MLREEIARVEEMIDEKLADFRLKLIAEFGPPPEKSYSNPELAKPITPVKKEPEKKVVEKK